MTRAPLRLSSARQRRAALAGLLYFVAALAMLALGFMAEPDPAPPNRRPPERRPVEHHYHPVHPPRELKGIPRVDSARA
jgi:hypothetical protein